jgi:hypothetical protein
MAIAHYGKSELQSPPMTARVALSALPPLTTLAATHDAGLRALLDRRPPLNALIEAGKVLTSFAECIPERGGEMKLSELQELVEDIAMQYGYDIPNVEIKNLKANLAMCRVYSNSVVFDARVVDANSRENVTKIIKHELAHFKEKYHNRRFRDELIRMGLDVYQRNDWHHSWYEVGQYVDPRPRYRRS